MTKFQLLTSVFLFLGSTCLFSQISTTSYSNNVSNIRVQKIDNILLIMYDLERQADIEVYASFDNGVTYRGPLQHVIGAAGNKIAPDRDKIVVWNIANEIGKTDTLNPVIKIVSFNESAGSKIITSSITEKKSFLVADGRNVYFEGRILTQPEVQEMMGNINAVQFYNKGITKNRTGNILILSYGGAVCMSSILCATFAKNSWDGLALGFVVSSITAFPALVSGIILKSTSKNPIKKSVNMYNSTSNQSGVDLKIGVTGNGVGLVMNF